MLFTGLTGVCVPFSKFLLRRLDSLTEGIARQLDDLRRDLPVLLLHPLPLTSSTFLSLSIQRGEREGSARPVIVAANPTAPPVSDRRSSPYA